VDSTLAAASLNRGILHYRRKEWDAALSDLRQAGANGADPAAVCYNRALVCLEQKDRRAALANLEESLKHNPRHKEARLLRDRLLRGR
jgi:tetratricopeptide (TPR) repeat protein